MSEKSTTTTGPDSGDYDPDDVSFKVYLLRPCDRQIQSPRDVAFPQAGQSSGAMNLCLIPTGLTIHVSVPEDESQGLH